MKFKKTMITALLATQLCVAGQTMSCEEYEKTVTAKDSWITCNIDDPRYAFAGV